MDAILAFAAVVFTASLTEAEIERVKTKKKSKLSGIYTAGLIVSLALISNDTLVFILIVLICIYFIILSVVIYLKFRREAGLTLKYVVSIFIGVAVLLMCVLIKEYLKQRYLDSILANYT